MLSHEQRLVITNVFHRLGWALAVAAAWAVGVVFLGYFVELTIVLIHFSLACKEFQEYYRQYSQ